MIGTSDQSCWLAEACIILLSLPVGHLLAHGAQLTDQAYLYGRDLEHLCKTGMKIPVRTLNVHSQVVRSLSLSHNTTHTYRQSTCSSNLTLQQHIMHIESTYNILSSTYMYKWTESTHAHLQTTAIRYVFLQTGCQELRTEWYTLFTVYLQQQHSTCPPLPWSELQI